MVRSLWTAATGMIAQQVNLDTIANNLSNVNTTGYKTQVNEFKSLLYQTIQTKTTSANGENKPSSAQVGLGVRNASISSIFKTGPMLASESDTAFALDGKGFFAIRGTDGGTYYTRNGNFKFTLATNGNMLATSEGCPVLDSNGRPIILGEEYSPSKISVTSDGSLCYEDANNNPQPIGITIGVYQFNNPNGLERLSESRYRQTAASGPALNEATNNNLDKTQVIQGYLEGSGVQVADEMVNMIVTQRAYELNSKAIIASDEMLQQANNLRR
ncbi:MAG: flagellar hook-basal body protein [Bacteroidales bacterium]|nr:flagellar hook-basal body protein [Lachnoclostridium sp.]MCM1383140.1 flagellar hook-basal body protein [Lachnoclostridium sp.]MCM1465368.1 flagellar hook-basal body protein [Bacteroidales bacterium]